MFLSSVDCFTIYFSKTSLRNYYTIRVSNSLIHTRPNIDNVIPDMGLNYLQDLKADEIGVYFMLDSCLCKLNERIYAYKYNYFIA